MLVPRPFNCDAARWDDYIEHLQTCDSDIWKLVAQYVVNKPPSKSQALLTQICSELNAGLSFADVDKSLQKAMAIADTVGAAAAAEAEIRTKTAETVELVAKNSIQDYIGISNVQGCDPLKFETYIKTHPDDGKQIQSLYTNWANFGGVDEANQKKFQQELDFKLQSVCTASNPDGRTSGKMYNSYAGWLLHQPPGLQSSLNTSAVSCSPLVLGPVMDQSKQKDKIYAFLDKVLPVDQQATVVSWMCSIAQTSPTEFEPAMTKLVQQDPAKVDVDAITKTLSPTVKAAQSFKILSSNVDIPVAQAEVKPLTAEEKAALVNKPANFDAWVAMNPKTQGLFTFQLDCQDTVGQYMNATTLSGEIYTRLNKDNVSEAEQISFFKKLCDQTSKNRNATAITDKWFSDYSTKYDAYDAFWKKTTMQAPITQWLQTHDKLAFVDDVYTNKLSKGASVAQTDSYVNESILAVPPPPPPPVPAVFKVQQPAKITHTPATNGQKKYVLKGYLTKSTTFVNAVFSLNPTSMQTAMRDRASYYATPMQSPDVGINDPNLQRVFTNYFASAGFLGISVPSNIQSASFEGFPYYVLFVSDAQGICQSIVAMGITDYSKILTSPGSVQPIQVKTDGVYQSLWILEDVDKAMSSS